MADSVQWFNQTDCSICISITEEFYSWLIVYDSLANQTAALALPY